MAVQDFGLWLKERCYKQKINEIIFKDMEKQPNGKDIYKQLGKVISDEEATVFTLYSLSLAQGLWMIKRGLQA